jgi:hypothetical protein
MRLTQDDIIEAIFVELTVGDFASDTLDPLR